MELKKIHIIGLGLLGGSFALGIKKAFPSVKISGTDRNPTHLDEAISLGIIDEKSDHHPQGADIIIIATPVHTISPLLQKILDEIQPETLVMDFGSTKEEICKAISLHPKRQNYLAAHPIAGTEYSGPAAALPDLLLNKIMILCELEKTDLQLKAKAYEIFEALNMKIRFMEPHDHDNQLAFVSHLSHISSFMLGKTVLDKMENDKNIFNMAGSGFASTVRLAKSSPDMWTPIMQENKTNILEALNGYIKNLIDFRDNLVNDEYEELFDKMKNTNQIGNILDLKK
ncbi:prephenate dehydrogenase [Echinicola sp. CAU 1574]|uniref:Prephenate dehydrogenase n=1 Tax=Echinicola arenosa TaxID=2774144 RepID=A0ABR9ANS4_9BACT|nr:prephenate dehydrogenase [Echinicola arenosa]MBD8490375.1 prephenate dehydrogenase [Echinicola arenosa]